MDLDSIDPRSLDLSHDVRDLSFRFYEEREALRLSVRRLTSPHAFDELGRPISRGLYDPALGPTSFDDGPCITCDLSYSNCPGHFGHIELPVPIPNPLLESTILKLLRASCWSCSCLRISQSDLNLLLARLYFEDAHLPRCGFAVEAFRVLKKQGRPSSNTVNSEGDRIDEPSFTVVKNWKEFLCTMPEPLASYMARVNFRDVEAVERTMLLAAENSWKAARSAGELVEGRSAGWKEAEHSMLSKRPSKCPRCLRQATKTRKGDRGRLFRASFGGGDILLSPTEIEAQVKGIWEEHRDVLELLFGLRGRSAAGEDSSGYMRLFVKVVLVPPSRFRPTSVVGNMAYAAEHPQNLFFQRLLKEIGIILTANEHGLAEDGKQQNSDDEEDDLPQVELPTKARFAQAMSNVQESVRDLYDSGGMSGNIQATGIRQQLEAKAGLFRQHMMGKRVNYSCRSVIGPDVFLDTSEIGIPESFAKLLTIPESVVPGNLDQMRRAVLNGPDVYPGAMAVEDWTNNGEHRIVKFKSSKEKKRLIAQAGLLIQNRIPNGSSHNSSGDRSKLKSNGVAPDARGQSPGNIPKRVHRHLRTGDIVLFNRQPTLHKVSIMAHKVRILPGERTIRFHYANCGSYNADFDGDEMNVHVPQDYIARAEAEELMLSSKHYVVPTSGAPIRGLIQDHIAAATLLSRRDTFLDRSTFIQLLYSATEKLMTRPEVMGRKYLLPEPAILRPRPLWTGKQLISSVLYVVRNGRRGINLNASTKTKSNIIGGEESHIVIRQGELLKGIVDKSSLGSSMYGIVHAVQEAYGNDASDDFLSCMSRLCLYFLRIHGHTTGVDDLVLNKPGDKKRIDILQESVEKVGVEVTNLLYVQMGKKDEEKRLARSDSEARDLVEEMIRRDGIEAEDRLDSAMKSALNKISSSVMKACVPVSLRKPFPENGFALMTNTGAKGSAVNAAQISCLLGSTVLEGKRVPRMGGSGATLPCFVPFDASPLAGGFIASRFLTGINPQEFFFHAMSGREGLLDTSLKTANSGYLQRCLVKHLEGIRAHYDGTVRDSDKRVLQFIYGDDGIDPAKSRWLNEKVEWQVSNKECLKGAMEKTHRRVLEIRGKRRVPSLRNEIMPTTALEEASPSALAKKGAVSESYNASIEKILKSDQSQPDVRSFLEERYQACALEPGEAVGVLAAQGVGEPSTQMTLNTFHHAGSSSAHVTLGIPRLRELLMTASKYPKTPSMTLLAIGKNPQIAAEKLSRILQSVKLLDLLAAIEVHDKSICFSPGLSDWAVRLVEVKMLFPEEDVYERHLGFNFDSVIGLVREKFLPELHKRLRREISRIGHESGKGRNPATRLYLRVAREMDNFGEETAVIGASDGGEDIEINMIPPEDEDDTEEAKIAYASSSDEEDDEDDDGDEKVKENFKPTTDEKYVETEFNVQELLKNQDGYGKPVKKHSKNRKKIDAMEAEQPKKSVGESGGTIGETFAPGSLGYVHSSLQREERRGVRFQWAFPVGLVGKLNIASVVRESAENVKLRHVNRISRCFIDSQEGRQAVITEGSNIKAILDIGYGLVDFDRLETNDMFGILRRYGVEAMRTALIREFVKVFDAYGIPVNIRHLQLIADYMTANGSYRGFNRRSMDEAPSPLQRMTFETSVNFLTEAALNSTIEHTKNPSAAVALGKVYEGGTGGFELVHHSISNQRRALP